MSAIHVYQNKTIVLSSHIPRNFTSTTHLKGKTGTMKTFGCLELHVLLEMLYLNNKASVPVEYYLCIAEINYTKHCEIALQLIKCNTENVTQ